MNNLQDIQILCCFDTHQYQWNAGCACSGDGHTIIDHQTQGDIGPYRCEFESYL